MIEGTPSTNLEKTSGEQEQRIKQKSLEELMKKRDDLLLEDENTGLYRFQNTLTLFEHLLIGSGTNEAGILDRNTPMTTLVDGDVEKTNKTRRFHFEEKSDFSINLCSPYEIVIKLKNPEQATTLDNINYQKTTFINAFTGGGVIFTDEEKSKILQDYFNERESAWETFKRGNTLHLLKLLKNENNS